MTLYDALLQDQSFRHENNLFYYLESERKIKFEENYIKLRGKEGRVYTDEIVKQLPRIPDSHPLKYEWRMRELSLSKLIRYLKKTSSHRSILEVGCGNGWLSNNLAISLDADICALDVNETELLQAARLFHKENLLFLYADLFRCDFSGHLFDVIILPSSVQYFRDLKYLISRLLELLTSSGEIHIIDSHFYSSPVEVQNAKNRSQDYFNSLGFPEMTNEYFHHSIEDLKGFNYKLVYNPKSFDARLKRIILRMHSSPLPWIQIKHG